MSLDTYLKSRADRCSGCGFHVETQGCRCGDEWQVFVTALRTAAVGGVVHQSKVRPLIQAIEPKHRGLMYRRAIKAGLIREVSREQSTDVAGRNTNKWEPVYELRSAA